MCRPENQSTSVSDSTPDHSEMARELEAMGRQLAELRGAVWEVRAPEAPPPPPFTEWERRAAKSRRRREARRKGLRLLTVCGRWREGGRFPDLRLTGRWLERAGFGLGQEVEVRVETGRLTIRAV